MYFKKFLREHLLLKNSKEACMCDNNYDRVSIERNTYF